VCGGALGSNFGRNKEGEMILDHVKRLEISNASFKNIFRYIYSSFSMFSGKYV